jgi:putative ABC transport system permease protein
MNLLPLVWAMLWRRKVRTSLTFASIAVAFLLFALLQSLADMFSAGVQFGGATNLQTMHRFGLIKHLPYAYRQQIEQVPGVAVVSPIVLFPIIYQDPGNSAVPSLATDPHTIFEDPRFVAPADQIRKFQETRTGMMASRALAEKYGWKIGDHLPLLSPWVRRKDGKLHWEFDLVGIFDFDEKTFGKGFNAQRAFLRYDYVDEVRVNPSEVTLFIVQAADTQQMTAVASAIDRLFQNSANPTKTMSETEQVRQTIGQIGDIGLIIRSILSAVFFTLVVVAGNTMMRVFRERIPELATMKALGFTDGAVARLMTLESVLLCGSAGIAGLFAAWLVMKPLAQVVAAVLPFLRLETGTVITGTLLALGLGLVASLIPAWQSARLNVVEGLTR